MIKLDFIRLEERKAVAEMPSGRPAALLWYLGLAVAVGGAIVGLVRLLDVMWVGHYHKVLIPLSILAAVLLVQGRKRLRVDGLALCLLVALPLGISVGILHGGTARYVLSHFGAAVFAFTVYTAANLTVPDATWLKQFWRTASYVILCSYALSIVAFWIINALSGHALYLGIGTGDVIFSLSYFLVYRIRWAALLCVFVILLSGKRGTLLSMLVVLLFYFRLPLLRGFYVRGVFSVVAALGLIFLTFYFREAVTSVRWPDAVGSILDKWYDTDPFSDAFNVDLAFSGRNLELSLAFTKFAEAKHHWLVGMGFGWSYFFETRLAGSATTDFFSHYVHLSPANIVLLHGVPLAVMTLFLMLRVIAKGYRVSEETTAGKMQKVLALFCVGGFVSSLSGYMYATDPFFWICLGTLSAVKRWRIVGEAGP